MADRLGLILSDLLVPGVPILEQENLERALITEDELLAAVRQHGFDRLDGLHRVVLETNGAISVVARRPDEANEIPALLAERLERIERQLAAIGARVGTDRV